MDFAIIAAGDGSRLKADGLNIPKPLVKISGKPLIKHIIDEALKNGASSISIIINEKSSELKNYLGSLKKNIPINLVVKTTPSSMHSLFALKKYLNDKPFILTTTDTVFLPNEFKDFVQFATLNKTHDGILAVTSFVEDENPLSVKVNDKMEILSFEDGLNDNKYVTGGIYYFSNKIFDEIELAQQIKIERLRNFLRLLSASNYSLLAYPFSKIIDVDHKEDIKTAEEFLSKESFSKTYSFFNPNKEIK